MKFTRLTLLLFLAVLIISCENEVLPELDSDDPITYEINASAMNQYANAIAVPPSIDYTGSVDVTDDLNNLIINTPDNSTLVFPMNATYKCEGIVRIENKVGLTVIGSGSTIVSMTDGSHITAPQDKSPHNWPRARQHLNINYSDHIKIIGLNIDGPHTNGGTASGAYVAAYEAQHGVDILGSTDVELILMDIKEVYGDFVYIGHGGGNVLSSDIRVDNCRMRKNGRQGISITMADNVSIVHNDLGEIRRGSIDIEPNTSSAYVTNVTIEGNVFGPGRLMWIASAGKGTVSDVYVRSNDLIGKNAQTIIGTQQQTTQNINFSNNYSDQPAGNPQMAIWKISYVDSFYAEHNHILAQAGRGMNLVGQRSSTISLGENIVENGNNAVITFP